MLKVFFSATGTPWTSALCVHWLRCGFPLSRYFLFPSFLPPWPRPLLAGSPVRRLSALPATCLLCLLRLPLVRFPDAFFTSLPLTRHPPSSPPPPARRTGRRFLFFLLSSLTCLIFVLPLLSSECPFLGLRSLLPLPLPATFPQQVSSLFVSVCGHSYRSWLHCPRFFPPLHAYRGLSRGFLRSSRCLPCIHYFGSLLSWVLSSSLHFFPLSSRVYVARFVSVLTSVPDLFQPVAFSVCSLSQLLHVARFPCLRLPLVSSLLCAVDCSCPYPPTSSGSALPLLLPIPLNFRLDICHIFTHRAPAPFLLSGVHPSLVVFPLLVRAFPWWLLAAP